MKWLKKALGRTGRKAAEEHVTRGYIAAHEGRCDQALQHYNDAIDADDTLAVAFFNAGQTELERFNRDVAALDDLQRAQRLKTAADLLEILRGWHAERRTIRAVLHDMTLVRELFPQTLLLARECVAFGATADVLTPANLQRARHMIEAFDESAHICEQDRAAAQ